MEISRLNVKDGSWEAFGSARWFRIRLGRKWFDLQEQDGALKVRTEGRITISPEAANTIVVDDTGH